MIKKEAAMPRPKRPRYIDAVPRVTEFVPRGAVPAEDVILSLEEFEAVRLIDYDGLDQTQAADIMNVSRQTVGRILRWWQGAVSQCRGDVITSMITDPAAEGIAAEVGAGAAVPTDHNPNTSRRRYYARIEQKRT